MVKRVVIYYPSYIVGGAEFLLKTAADILKKEIPTVIVDFKNGWLSKNIENVNIIYIENKLIELDCDTVVITTANLVRNLDNIFSGNFKLISWIVHIFNVIPVLPKFSAIQHRGIVMQILESTILRGEKKYFKKQVDFLRDNNSIFTMDDCCAEIVYTRLGTKLTDYLPVVIPGSKIVIKNKLFDNCEYRDIRLVWLGRLDGEFKNPILERVIKDVNYLTKISGLNFTFEIIGHGPGFEDILFFSEKFKRIKFIFYKEKTGEALQKILRTADIGFAMGTSALEIAACRTPTVLLDASYKFVSNKYRYKWLFEEQGYCLGRSIDSSVDESMGNKFTFKDIISNFIKDPLFYSESCYKHVLNNHTEESLKGKLFEAIYKTKFSFENAKSFGLFKKAFWYSIKKIII